jgi:hypothetical protein
MIGAMVLFVYRPGAIGRDSSLLAGFSSFVRVLRGGAEDTGAIAEAGSAFGIVQCVVVEGVLRHVNGADMRGT